MILPLSPRGPLGRRNDYAVTPPQPGIPNWVTIVIVTVTLGIVACVIIYYRCWRWRRNTRSSDSPAATSPPAIPATNVTNRTQRRNRGVWRSEVVTGLPTYTVQAREGELSLGGARKPSTEDEGYELEATTSAPHGQDADAVPETNDPELPTAETLEPHPPPYIPPPLSAVVRPRTASNT